MTDRLLTPKEVADILQVSYWSALQFIQYSGVPYIKINRQYRVSEERLTAFLLKDTQVVAKTAAIPQPPNIYSYQNKKQGGH